MRIVLGYVLFIVLVLCQQSWKWLLFQTIFDGYFLWKHFVMHNEGHVPNADEVGAVGVKKNKYTFQKRK
jgi:hypothetical protein